MQQFYNRKATPSYAQPRRLYIVSAFFLCFATILVGRLFYLQVWQHTAYVDKAQAQHLEGVELSARRGNIMATDYHSNRNVTLATNSTWYLLYVDPLVVDEPDTVADFLTPHVYNSFCAQRIDQRVTKEMCVTAVSQFLGLIENNLIPRPASTRVEEATPDPTPAATAAEDAIDETPANEGDTDEIAAAVETAIEEETVPAPPPAPTLPITPKVPLSLTVTEEEMKELIRTEIFKKISVKETTFTQLKLTSDQEILNAVTELNIPGVTAGRTIIWANPQEVRNPQLAAQQLSPILSLDIDYLERVLSPRPLRYVPIIRRLDPVISDRIDEAKRYDQREFFNKTIPYPLYRGVVLLPESYRYYPEGVLASQVIGFVDHSQTGRYGIEEMYDKELRGSPGKIIAESDPFGRQITIRKSIIEPPRDGDDIILTIDRVVQQEVETQLKKAVLDTRANSGQIVVMDPRTGDIIAMANYPTFDPNDYGEVYRMQPITFDPGRDIPVFTFNEEGSLRPATEAERTMPLERYVYRNRFGPGAYQNLAISGSFEPGSIFKPIIMIGALDAQELSPTSRYYDAGSIEVDTFTIRNATQQCTGNHTMIHAMNYSCNIGMIHVAKKLGRSLTYKYYEDFGFGERTLIELAGEVKGGVSYYRDWSDARFYNTSFGQGLTVTPIQMASAYTAIANGGLLLKPNMVKQIIKSDGTIIDTKPTVVRQVVSQAAANSMTAMLTNSVDDGLARSGGVPGYNVAGKTGTSQTTYRGRYQRGAGNTITTYAGYAPSNNPVYVMVIKIDRPRSTEWSEGSSSPLFGRLSAFLLDYYNVPPNQ